MTEIREKVARAICGASNDLEMGRIERNGRMTQDVLADAALSALGWREMEEAMKGLLEVAEYARPDQHHCRWDDGSEKHCKGACEAVGCLAIKMEAARTALSRARGEKT